MTHANCRRDPVLLRCECPPEPPEWALHIAAQLWCEDKHSHKVLDTDLALSIAQALRRVRDEALEEAARVADDAEREKWASLTTGLPVKSAAGIARAIRALKERAP